MHIYYENIKVRFLKITMKKQLFDHITLCVNISSKMTFFCDHEKSNFFVIIMKNRDLAIILLISTFRPKGHYFLFRLKSKIFEITLK